jgi:hypothetical protein
MVLVIILDILAVAAMIFANRRKGFRFTLPLAAFLLILFPEESKVSIAGLFDVTTQRVVVITLVVLSASAGGQGSGGRRKLPLKPAIVGMALWWMLSSVNSIVFADSFKALLSLVLDYLLVYVIFAKFVPDVATVQRILFGIAAAVAICSVFGTLEAYAQWSVVSLFPTAAHRFGSSGGLYIDEARGLRVQSTFGHPILFGSALAMAIPITLHLISVAKKSGEKIFLWVGILLMFICIFKTSSRGPWMALGFSLMLLMVFGQKKVRRYIAVICLLAISVLVIRPGVGETLWNDYAATMDDHSAQGESYRYRYQLYSLVVQKLDESFDRALLGYGPQSYPYLHLTGDINGRTMVFESCDSSVAALLVETGYIGLLIVASLFAFVLLSTFRTSQRLRPPGRQLCILFVANLATFCFQMTNVAIFLWGQQTILLWVVMALAITYPRLAKAEVSVPFRAMPRRSVDAEPQAALV